VTAHQKPLARFRVIADSLPADEQIPKGTEPKKYGETRYGSRVTMSERMINTKPIYEKLMIDQEYISWLDRQATKTKEKVRMCIAMSFMYGIVTWTYINIFGIYSARHLTPSLSLLYVHSHTGTQV
jgi:hypothetical protein